MDEFLTFWNNLLDVEHLTSHRIKSSIFFIVWKMCFTAYLNAQVWHISSILVMTILALLWSDCVPWSMLSSLHLFIIYVTKDKWAYQLYYLLNNHNSWFILYSSHQYILKPFMDVHVHVCVFISNTLISILEIRSQRNWL